MLLLMSLSALGFVDFESGPRRIKHANIGQFGETKEWTTMTTRQANKEYILVPRDLEGLPFMEKTSAYSRYDHRGDRGADEPPPEDSGERDMMRLYYLTDVQDRALDKYGSKEALLPAGK